jgi:hypothetical protein
MSWSPWSMRRAALAARLPQHRRKPRRIRRGPVDRRAAACGTSRCPAPVETTCAGSPAARSSSARPRAAATPAVADHRAQAVTRLLKDKRRWEVRSAGKSSKGDRWYAWAWLGTAAPSPAGPPPPEDR